MQTSYCAMKNTKIEEFKTFCGYALDLFAWALNEMKNDCIICSIKKTDLVKLKDTLNYSYLKREDYINE